MRETCGSLREAADKRVALQPVPGLRLILIFLQTVRRSHLPRPLRETPTCMSCRQVAENRDALPIIPALMALEEFSTAFIPDWFETSEWRRYRGGRTHPIKIINLSDYSVEKLPWNNSNDSDPMWVGNTIYFLSDRNHAVNLFSYRPDTKQV